MDLQAVKARHGVGVALAVGLSGVILWELALPLTCAHMEEQRHEERWGRWYDRHLETLTRHYGPPPGVGGDRFEYKEFELLLLEDSMAIRMVVIDDMRPVAPELAAALDFHGPDKRKWEAGEDLVYDDRTGRLRLIISKPIATPDVHKAVEDARDLARWWREEWLPQLAEVAAGKRPPPEEHVYRPGKDPASRIREVKAFLDEIEAKQPRR